MRARPPSQSSPPAPALRLLDDPLLGSCSKSSLARLLPHLRVLHVRAGALVLAAGQVAETFFLVTEGTLQHVGAGCRRWPAITAHFGLEAACGGPQYLHAVRAVSDVVLLCLPRAAMREVARANPGLHSTLLLALGCQLAGQPPAPCCAPAAKPDSTARRAPAWLLAAAAPLAILAGGAHLQLPSGTLIFLATFGATVALWVLSLVDDYVAALFAVLAMLLTGLAPVPVILSGFASDGFLLALSSLALGALVLSSGLGYRVMLLLLHRLPDRPFWHNAGLFATGLLLTPIIPTANGRLALLAPFYADMVDGLRLPHRGAAATRLALSCFGGASLCSAVFITSKSVNFVVFGMLTPQGQDHFQWLAWCQAGVVSGAVLVLLNVLAAALYLPGGAVTGLPAVDVAAQRAMLGPVTRREWAALSALGFMLAGLLTGSLHKVAPAWLGFTMLAGLLLSGTLDRQELKKHVDWTFLLYLGGIGGIAATFVHLGLDRQLGAALPPMGHMIRAHVGWFVLVLFGLVNLIRLAVPSNATTVILATVLMPLAQHSGVNEWLVGFLILLFSDAWFFPYQCSYYLQLQQLSAQLYDETRFLRLNAVLNGARLLAAWATLPYWAMLGIL